MDAVHAGRVSAWTWNSSTDQQSHCLPSLGPAWLPLSRPHHRCHIPGGVSTKKGTHTRSLECSNTPNPNGSKPSPPRSKTCKYSLCYCAGRHLPLSTGSQEHGKRSRRVEVPPQPGKQWLVSPASHHCLFSLRLNPRLWLPNPPTPSSTAG